MTGEVVPFPDRSEERVAEEWKRRGQLRLELANTIENAFKYGLSKEIVAEELSMLANQVNKGE